MGLACQSWHYPRIERKKGKGKEQGRKRRKLWISSEREAQEKEESWQNESRSENTCCNGEFLLALNDMKLNSIELSKTPWPLQWIPDFVYWRTCCCCFRRIWNAETAQREWTIQGSHCFQTQKGNETRYSECSNSSRYPLLMIQSLLISWPLLECFQTALHTIRFENYKQNKFFLENMFRNISHFLSID